MFVRLVYPLWLPVVKDGKSMNGMNETLNIYNSQRRTVAAVMREHILRMSLEQLLVARTIKKRHSTITIISRKERRVDLAPRQFGRAYSAPCFFQTRNDVPGCVPETEFFSGSSFLETL